MCFFAASAGAGRHHDPMRQVARSAVPRRTTIFLRIDAPSVRQTMESLGKIVTRYDSTVGQHSVSGFALSTSFLSYVTNGNHVECSCFVMPDKAHTLS